MMSDPLLRISSVSLLSLLQRQKTQLPGASQISPLDMRAVAAELDAAQTVAEKLVILERLLKKDLIKQEGSPATFAASPSPEEQLNPPWKVSDKSTALMNELPYQQYGRQWEADAVIKAVIEQVHHGRSECGAAMPFKPSVVDMEKAIEALGYSPRSLFGLEDQARGLESSIPDVGGRMLRIAAIAFTGMMIGILLFSV